MAAPSCSTVGGSRHCLTARRGWGPAGTARVPGSPDRVEPHRAIGSGGGSAVSPDPARAGVHRRPPHPRRAHLHPAHPPPNRSPCPPGPRGQRRGGSRTWRQRRRHRPGTGWITGHRPARGRRQARSRRHWGGLTFWNAATPSPPRSPTWPGSGTAVKTGRRARWLTSTRHARPDHDRPSCPRQDGLTRLHPGSLPPPSPCVTGVSAGTIARQARLAACEDVWAAGGLLDEWVQGWPGR